MIHPIACGMRAGRATMRGGYAASEQDVTLLMSYKTVKARCAVLFNSMIRGGRLFLGKVDIHVNHRLNIVPHLSCGNRCCYCGAWAWRQHR